jgi:WD40 repeat protein
VEQVGFSPDGKYLLAAEQGPKIMIWDGGDFTPQSPYIGHADRINFFQISSDNQHVVSADKSDIVQVWALEGRNKKAEIKVEGLSDARIAPDGQQVLLRNDTAVWCWNWPAGSAQNKPLVLPDQDDFPITAGYSGDGEKVIVATLNQRLHTYDRDGRLLESGMAPGEVSGLYTRAGSADFVLLTQPDSAWFISAKQPKRLFAGSRKVQWDAQSNMVTLLSKSGEQLCLNSDTQYPFAYFLSHQSGGINDFSLHPKGGWLAAGVNENAVWLWRVPPHQRF